MTAVPKPKLELVPMADADIDVVTAIEQRAHPFPWTRGNFIDSLKAGHSAWVFREGGAMVGYGVLMMTVDEAELLDITIVPECQRRGLGSMLLDQLFDVARSHGATRMLLEVRPGNEPGLALYRRFGFAEIGRRRAYYRGKEDAIVMARDL
jgi:[ribosomal protein S18]-alanine N-acetyltransferase